MKREVEHVEVRQQSYSELEMSIRRRRKRGFAFFSLTQEIISTTALVSIYMLCTE